MPSPPQLDGRRDSKSACHEILKLRLLEELPAGAYTCDADGLITYFNRQAVELWGRAPKLYDSVDRFCGSFKLYSADGAPISHDQCWMALALETGQAYIGQEIIIERPDGRRLTVLAHASPVRDDAGNLIGAANVLVDLTERKRAEQAQAQLAVIVESSDDAIVSKTLDGTILSWNVGAERLLGYTAEEAIGQSITLIIPPERHDEERAILARLRAGQRIDHYETVRVAKDGRLIDVSLTVSPIRDAAGRIVGASKVARDITARKLAEEALVLLRNEMATQLADMQRLHEMSVRLATTVEMQPILDEALRTAIAIEHADFGILSLCESGQSRLHVGASVGFDDDFLNALKRVPPGAGACGACFREGRRVVVEDVETNPLFTAFRDAARRAGFRAVHSTPLVARSGEVVGVLSTQFRDPHRPTDREMRLIDLCARQAVDFLENARLYAELREADRRKDEFLATLAHELRNPLAPICNSLQLLRLADDLSPTAHRIREILERQVGHLVRLVDDLLEVSRITRGKIELRKEPVELATIVTNAVEASRPLIESAGHQLAVSLPRELITLEADAVRLAQVLTNLLNNAAKYTEPGGQIWLIVHQDASQAVVRVRDTGVGIPAEMLPHVFDMFTQVDRTLNRAQGGLGIGLTLAKELVHSHGGRIEAHSPGPGRGSEFVVRLPLLNDAVRAAGLASDLPAAGSPLPARRILVVDDARDAAFALGKMLETLGQQVHTARDAAAALEEIKLRPPHVVISDIAMPGMDGYELARKIRIDDHPDRLILVAVTGYGQQSDRQRAKDAGFDYHLTKPVSFAELRDLLASLPTRAERSEVGAE